MMCLPIKSKKTKHWHCSRCSYPFKNMPDWIEAHQIHRQCAGRRVLGDWVAMVLSWFGIVKSSSCKCQQRQAWLNRVWFKLLERLKR